MSANPTLVYWSLNARANPAFFVAALGGITLEWDDTTANTWPAPKGTAPFGQLPLLKDGGLTLSQSFALVRYLARKGGVQGDDLASYGISEMITEEAADLFGALAKSKYAADPIDAYTKFYDETLTTQLGYLANLLHGPFFGGEKALQGDAALFAVFYLISRNNADLFKATLAKAPKVEAWYHAFAALPSIQAALKIADAKGAYFTWPQ